jgi:hypothetical protein
VRLFTVRHFTADISPCKFHRETFHHGHFTVRHFTADISPKLVGLFDGIYATELEHNSVLTFGDQFIETPLVIAEGHQVGAGIADVKNTLNGISSSDLLFIDQPMTVASAVLNELQAENLHVNGFVDGPGVFSSINITDLSTNYLSKTPKQKILVPVRNKSLATNGTFGATSINGIDFPEVYARDQGL